MCRRNDLAVKVLFFFLFTYCWAVINYIWLYSLSLSLLFPEDKLHQDSGECSICLEDMVKGKREGGVGKWVEFNVHVFYWYINIWSLFLCLILP